SEAMMTYAVPAIKDLIKFASGEVMQPEELYSYEFQNAFFLFKMISDEKDMVYRSTLNSIAELKILLNKELNPGS
ncbi:MAG: hypothetical protein HKO94_12000, partial [Flavobacteriaceae bacterium]|nr:hypothetical protein [Flavobacteriaceae bacterium]